MANQRSGRPEDRHLVIAITLGAFLAVLACGAIVAELVEDVFGNEGVTRLDPLVTDIVVQNRTAWLNSSARAVTRLADPLTVVVVVAIAVLGFVASQRTKLAAFLVLSVAGAQVATSLGKLLVDRPRPPSSIWLVHATGAAFPSGHATQAVACWLALAVCMAALSRRRWLRAGWISGGAVLALVIGGSRIYLGVHWMSDVLCGWAVAGGWLLALVLIGWSGPRITTFWRL